MDNQDHRDSQVVLDQQVLQVQRDHLGVMVFKDPRVQLDLQVVPVQLDHLDQMVQQDLRVYQDPFLLRKKYYLSVF